MSTNAWENPCHHMERRGGECGPGRWEHGRSRVQHSCEKCLENNENIWNGSQVLKNVRKKGYVLNFNALWDPLRLLVFFKTIMNWRKHFWTILNWAFIARSYHCGYPIHHQLEAALLLFAFDRPGNRGLVMSASVPYGQQCPIFHVTRHQ